MTLSAEVAPACCCRADPHQHDKTDATHPFPSLSYSCSGRWLGGSALLIVPPSSHHTLGTTLGRLHCPHFRPRDGTWWGGDNLVSNFGH